MEQEMKLLSDLQAARLLNEISTKGTESLLPIVGWAALVTERDRLQSWVDALLAYVKDDAAMEPCDIDTCSIDTPLCRANLARSLLASLSIVWSR
ncbi:MAG TPA: hypothetical protein VFB50_00495 [Chloroflexota bacterium]|nr:hypothetical protein [Chloroflexota bacterium]